jgi:hypothetical protein
MCDSPVAEYRVSFWPIQTLKLLYRSFAVPATLHGWLWILPLQFCMLGILEHAEGTRCWQWIGAAAVVSTVSRQLMGYLMTRGVGWAYPSLYSHDSLYTCYTGN